MHLSPAQLGLSFGLFNYARGRRYSRRHPLPARRFFLSSARAFGPQKSRKCKKCGIFGVFAWDVAYGAHTQCPASQFGRERRGEAWGDRGALGSPLGDRGRTRVKETRWISCGGSPRRVLSMLGSLERWGGVVLPVVPSHPPEILAGARYSTYCDLN